MDKSGFKKDWADYIMEAVFVLIGIFGFVSVAYCYGTIVGIISYFK